MGRPTAPRETQQDRVEARAQKLMPEERDAGTDDALRQAATILDESDERSDGRVADLVAGERRRSRDTVEPTDEDR